MEEQLTLGNLIRGEHETREFKTDIPEDRFQVAFRILWQQLSLILRGDLGRDRCESRSLSVAESVGMRMI